MDSTERPGGGQEAFGAGGRRRERDGEPPRMKAARGGQRLVVAGLGAAPSSYAERGRGRPVV